MSPLYEASSNGHLEVVRAFIEAGANIHQTDKVSQEHYWISPWYQLSIKRSSINCANQFLSEFKWCACTCLDVYIHVMCMYFIFKCINLHADAGCYMYVHGIVHV